MSTEKAMLQMMEQNERRFDEIRKSQERLDDAAQRAVEEVLARTEESIKKMDKLTFNMEKVMERLKQ